MVLWNNFHNAALNIKQINSKINTEGIDYFSQGHWNGNVYIENEHLKNKKFYVVVYAPIPNNVYSDNFSLKVSYKANLRHTFKFALQKEFLTSTEILEQEAFLNQISTIGCLVYDNKDEFRKNNTAFSLLSIINKDLNNYFTIKKDSSKDDW